MRGDEALYEYCLKFDGYKITDEKLKEVVYEIMMMDADSCMEMDRIELVNYIENMLCIKI